MAVWLPLTHTCFKFHWIEQSKMPFNDGDPWMMSLLDQRDVVHPSASSFPKFEMIGINMYQASNVGAFGLGLPDYS